MSSTILRQASVAARQVSRRAFGSSAVVQQGTCTCVNSRLSSPAPAAKDAHVGAVKSFSMPPTPKAPAVPADLASELSAYDAAEPTLETVQASSTGAAEEQAGAGADEFLAFLEKDVPKPEHHH
ncbi:hypothetical protein BKA70DRAFT_1422712 [Coprinopsis sp. MPI-PUGE-AT-0042]|nr:hypothetical protein BKA70DRAFT_1422712 [Coprinopsis sp. MPI-PUGE-AT-0042]